MTFKEIITKYGRKAKLWHWIDEKLVINNVLITTATLCTYRRTCIAINIIERIIIGKCLLYTQDSQPEIKSINVQKKKRHILTFLLELILNILNKNKNKIAIVYYSENLYLK
jgi:hypothetical protein